jgi:outer membrane protein
MLPTQKQGLAALFGAALALAAALPVAAQEGSAEPWRYRVTLGPQSYPSYPGSDSNDFGPFFNVDRARGDDPFEFEAPDEALGFALVRAGRFSIGPAINWEGARTGKDVGADLPKVKFSLETGAFAALDLSRDLRLRAEVRKGVTGHKGWIALAGADWVARDDDRWLFSLGPRVTWSDGRYQDAWFGVMPDAAASSGLPVYDADGGIQAVGAAGSFLRQLGPHWGIAAYAKYDRLVGDAADSPLVRTYGSRNQFSGGLALSYTWGGRR